MARLVLHITLIEPFLGGSHRAWAEGYRRHSAWQVEVMGLPGRHWKWRMHGGAVTLARQFLASAQQPDVVLATDMLDLGTFLGLTGERLAATPTVIYFHENQFAYPWSANDPDVQAERDHHYGFINFTSALAAGALWFNSAYNRDAFLAGCQRLLAAMPDHRELDTLQTLEAKSRLVPLGLELRGLDAAKPERRPDGPPLLLWNHRWEHDKNPEAFFGALYRLLDQGLDFHVAVVGEQFEHAPSIFAEARWRLGDRIRQWGYAPSFEDYAQWLWHADILPVTSHHDFFGISVAEAIYCRTLPLLPDALAYPELIPSQWHRTCLYQDPTELDQRLAQWLVAPPVAARQPLRQAVAGHEWQIMAPYYDTLLADEARL